MAAKKVAGGASKKAVGLGAALAAAAAGAGFYFYGHRNAEKNRSKAAKWARDLHKDVLAKAKKVQDLDERAFRTLVDEGMRAYETVKKVDARDLAAAADELKQSWAHVERELSRTAKKGKVVAKKAVVLGKKEGATIGKTAKRMSAEVVSTAKKVTKTVTAKAPAKKVAKKVAKKG